MDPIHPILPQPPNIPPVMPATNAGRVDRDGQRGRQAEDEKRSRPGSSRAAVPPSDHGDPSAEAAGEEHGLHIDITA